MIDCKWKEPVVIRSWVIDRLVVCRFSQFGSPFVHQAIRVFVCWVLYDCHFGSVSLDLFSYCSPWFPRAALSGIKSYKLVSFHLWSVCSTVIHLLCTSLIHLHDNHMMIIVLPLLCSNNRHCIVRMNLNSAQQVCESSTSEWEFHKHSRDKGRAICCSWFLRKQKIKNTQNVSSRLVSIL